MPSPYDLGLPCKNPNCKSDGSPHGNCKCYGNLADGGEAKNVCELSQPHMIGCEYYKDGGEVPADDLPEQEVPADDFPQVQSQEVPKEDLPAKHDSIGEKILTGVEGLGEGFAGPLTTGLELGAHKLGLDQKLGIDTSAEAIKEREQENPMIKTGGKATAIVGGLLTGTGEAALVSNLTKRFAPEAVTIMAKIGTAAAQGFVNNFLLQGADEMSKAMLGQGDQEAPVASAMANMTGAGLLGGITGGIFEGAGLTGKAALRAVEDAKLGTKFRSFVAGIGDASRPVEESAVGPVAQFAKRVEEKRAMKALKIEDMDVDAFQRGKDFVKALPSKLARIVTDTAAGIASHAAGASLPESFSIGATFDKLLGPYIEKLVGKNLSNSKVIQSAALKVLSSGNIKNVADVIDYATKIERGTKQLQNGVGALFKVVGPQVFGADLSKYITSQKEEDKLDDFIKEDGISKQIENAQPEPVHPQFAEGGEVQPADVTPAPTAQAQSNGIQQHFPTQNMLLNTAKGRVFNYLKQMRPVDAPGSMFDEPFNDKAKAKAYKEALHIANKPLIILKHIQDGTIQPDHVKHLATMYPEIRNQLVKHVSDQVAKLKSKNEKPSYKLRLGLSLLTGSPFDSTMTPMLILAAQPQTKPDPAKTQGKPAKATANQMAKRASSYNLPNQAAELDKSDRR